MQTVIIKLDSTKMRSPNLDIRYRLPERVEEISHNTVRDNGYEYISNTQLGIWLEAEQAEPAAELIVKLISDEQILGNDLSLCAQVYISSEECADLSDCRLVYPK